MQINPTRFNRRSISSHSLDSHLYAHWPLNERTRYVHDCGPRNLDGFGSSPTTGIGELIGSATWAIDPQRGGYVLSLPVFGSFVLFNSQFNNDQLFNITTGSFSATVWAKYSTSYGNTWPAIIGKIKSQSTTAGWGLNLNSSASGTPYIEIGDGSNTASASWSTFVTDSQWHFHVVVLDRIAQVCKISIDGKPFVVGGSTAAVGSIDSTTAGFKIGCRPDGSGLQNCYNGFVSDVRLYRDIALRQSAVTQLYQAGLIGDRVPNISNSRRFLSFLGTPDTAIFSTPMNRNRTYKIR